jgi:hypothetical protein
MNESSASFSPDGDAVAGSMAPTAATTISWTMEFANERNAMPWVVIGLLVGLVAVGAGIGAVLVARRRGPNEHPEMTGDQLFTLGVIFTGTGIALGVAVNPGMLGIMMLGIIYMAMGAQMKRREDRERDEGTT